MERLSVRFAHERVEPLNTALTRGVSVSVYGCCRPHDRISRFTLELGEKVPQKLVPRVCFIICRRAEDSAVLTLDAPGLFLSARARRARNWQICWESAGRALQRSSSGFRDEN